MNPRPLSITPPAIAAVWLALLFGSGAAPAQRQTPPTSATNFSAGEVYEQLNRLADLDRAQIALRTALAFCLAVGVGDGAAAAERIDAVGYQQLPAVGPLPLDPQRPIPARRIGQWVDVLPDVAVDRLPAGRFRLIDRAALAARAPAAATWMLPRDYAVLIEPDASAAGWVRRPACLIVRVRGRRGTIVAGTLFSALARVHRGGAPNGERRSSPADSSGGHPAASDDGAVGLLRPGECPAAPNGSRCPGGRIADA